MSLATPPESAQAIALRMESQRAQLHRQFVQPPAPPTLADLPSPSPSTAMQPYQPKSFLMKMIVANPQIIQRVAMLAVTTALGARYSSWAMRLMGLFMAARKR